MVTIQKAIDTDNLDIFRLSYKEYFYVEDGERTTDVTEIYRDTIYNFVDIFGLHNHLLIKIKNLSPRSKENADENSVIKITRKEYIDEETYQKIDKEFLNDFMDIIKSCLIKNSEKIFMYIMNCILPLIYNIFIVRIQFISLYQFTKDDMSDIRFYVRSFIKNRCNIQKIAALSFSHFHGFYSMGVGSRIYNGFYKKWLMAIFCNNKLEYVCFSAKEGKCLLDDLNYLNMNKFIEHIKTHCNNNEIISYYVSKEAIQSCYR